MNDSLAFAFKLQRMIVHALMLQDLNSRYARLRLGVFTVILEQVLMVSAIYFARMYVQGMSKVGQVPLLLFIITGFMTDFCFRHIVNGVSAATARKSNSRMFPQVAALDVIIARAISSCLINLGILIAAFALASIMYNRPPDFILLVIVSEVMVGALAVATGIAFGVVLRRYPSFIVFTSVVLRLNIFLNGAAYLGSEIPEEALRVVSWNPVFHLIEMLREGWSKSYHSPVVDPMYPLLIILFVLAIGLSLERLTKPS